VDAFCIIEKVILEKVIFICKELRIYKWRLKLIQRGNIFDARIGDKQSVHG
jgi:hypothetical protein